MAAALAIACTVLTLALLVGGVRVRRADPFYAEVHFWGAGAFALVALAAGLLSLPLTL